MQNAECSCSFLKGHAALKQNADCRLQNVRLALEFSNSSQNERRQENAECRP